MANKIILGLILAQIWSPKFFSWVYMLYIVVSYHCMQFQGKVMNQTWKNGKKLVLSTILAPSAQIWAPKNFFMDFTSTIY